MRLIHYLQLTIYHIVTPEQLTDCLRLFAIINYQFSCLHGEISFWDYAKHENLTAMNLSATDLIYRSTRYVNIYYNRRQCYGNLILSYI